jgi:hypothetical protein
MREEVDPSGHMESSSSNHRDAKGEKWIGGDTSGLTTHASSRSDKPADIEIPIPTSRSPDTTRALVYATSDISAFGILSVQISPRAMLP